MSTKNLRCLSHHLPENNPRTNEFRCQSSTGTALTFKEGIKTTKMGCKLPKGLEPSTYALRMRRTTDCATEA